MMVATKPEGVSGKSDWAFVSMNPRGGDRAHGERADRKIGVIDAPYPRSHGGRLTLCGPRVRPPSLCAFRSGKSKAATGALLSGPRCVASVADTRRGILKG